MQETHPPSAKEIKIAIIDHMINVGGGSRVLRNLLPAMKKLRPDWNLVLYANKAAIQRDGLQDELAPYLTIRWLKSIQLINTLQLFKIRGAKLIISFFQKKFKKILSFFPYFFSGALDKEVQDISKKSDLIFCPWPYLIECPKSICIPVVAIFHDFNFRYYFNGPSFHPLHLESFENEIPRWLRISSQ